MATDDSAQALTSAARKLGQARTEAGKVIFGQDEVLDRILTGLIAGGHVLLVGAPGLAKTLMVETVGKVMNLSTARIQCTPDLMPSDILGAEVLEQDDAGKRHFRFIQGPVFTQFLMADEINRASPRTQSALLQAMQEGTVTIAGKAHALPRPFHVLATQNPIEQEGTYPLPEAQLDRFLMQIDVDYPAHDDERRIVLATTGNTQAEPQSVFSGGELIDLQKLVRDMPVGDSVVEAILTLVRRGRPGPNAAKEINDYVSWAPGPRAAQALMLTCRARALLQGRLAPSVDDVLALAESVLKHRMALNFQARSENVALADILRIMNAGL